MNSKISWISLLIALLIYFFVICSVIYLVKVNAESIEVGAYVENNCQNTRCEVVKWNGRNILISLF